MGRLDRNALIKRATNPRYISFVSVSEKNKCQNWRFLDFISQMHGEYNRRQPISDHEEFTRFIENNKLKYEAHIYET